jgi:hypothetical protein
MIRDYTTIICPLPGMGHCVRERCNFWDGDREACTCGCFDTGGPGKAGSTGNSDWPCVISFDEDYD